MASEAYKNLEVTDSELSLLHVALKQVLDCNNPAAAQPSIRLLLDRISYTLNSLTSTNSPCYNSTASKDAETSPTAPCTSNEQYILDFLYASVSVGQGMSSHAPLPELEDANIGNVDFEEASNQDSDSSQDCEPPQPSGGRVLGAKGSKLQHPNHPYARICTTPMGEGADARDHAGVVAYANAGDLAAEAHPGKLYALLSLLWIPPALAMDSILLLVLHGRNRLIPASQRI
ncbi:hypothetical protein F4604DRAFT_1924060 [Suillus subluteus]|nr:hypothetical protein F4604DRAFT_1924060 [Suillus subluteus]